MTIRQPALFMQARVDHDAEAVRRWMSAMFQDRPGIFGTADFAVTARGTPDRSVDVAGGRAMIEGEATIYQGMYFVENRGSLNIPLVAADPTNGRIDLIVARVRDEQYTGGTAGSPWEIVAIAGTPAPSPAPPARPSNSIELARVSVLSLAARNPTTVTTAEITDRRPGQAAVFGGAILVADAATRTALTDLLPGMIARELDTFRTFMWDGTKWVYQFGGTLFQGTAQMTGTTITTTETWLCSVLVPSFPYPHRVRYACSINYQLAASQTVDTHIRYNITGAAAAVTDTMARQGRLTSPAIAGFQLATTLAGSIDRSVATGGTTRVEVWALSSTGTLTAPNDPTLGQLEAWVEPI